MSKVFVDVGLSLDGYLAGPNRRPGNPLGDGGPTIHNWLFQTAYFREMLSLPPGQPSPDDPIVRALFDRAGAYVMGRRMFDEGEVGWPENAPFHAPVFVLTHAPRAPWPRPGGTTFHFVTDGIESALRPAQAPAAEKNIRISGGADTIRQYLLAGLDDEITIHVAPLLLGSGLRLFDTSELAGIRLEQRETVSSPLVTHINYRVVR